jgi:hypothetical protein
VRRALSTQGARNNYPVELRIIFMRVKIKGRKPL